MRKIKFRAWDKKMNEMNYSGKVVDEDGEPRKAMSFFFAGYCENVKGNICSSVNIMQFTGLKDKNGKEIYEGDIIDGRYGKAIVKYCVNHCGFLPFSYSSNAPKEDECKVIGNIYENPDLQSGGQK